MFNHPDGSHYSQPTIWKEFQNILAAAGLEHHRVHDLRHTFAVNSIMAGDDIKTLQENRLYNKSWGNHKKKDK